MNRNVLLNLYKKMTAKFKRMLENNNFFYYYEMYSLNIRVIIILLIPGINLRHNLILLQIIGKRNLCFFLNKRIFISNISLKFEILFDKSIYSYQCT